MGPATFNHSLVQDLVVARVLSPRLAEVVVPGLGGVGFAAHDIEVGLGLFQVQDFWVYSAHPPVQKFNVIRVPRGLSGKDSISYSVADSSPGPSGIFNT